MSAEIIQFIPRPNPNRDIPVIELSPLQVDALAIVGDIMSNLGDATYMIDSYTAPESDPA